MIWNRIVGAGFVGLAFGVVGDDIPESLIGSICVVTAFNLYLWNVKER